MNAQGVQGVPKGHQCPYKQGVQGVPPYRGEGSCTPSPCLYAGVPLPLYSGAVSDIDEQHAHA